ncbi:MAG: DUF1996 domain-containing protein [Microthrixaceae bacterium]|nr:DUF1996 domain-containing protein [Microthrixaceae bacterium]
MLADDAPVAVADHGHSAIGEPIGTPTRWTGPQGRTGQFVAKCTYSHSAPDDPIVHFEHPGLSHRHDFYGAEETDAFSTAEQLLESPTTCDKPADLAAYWQPTLYDHDEIVEPLQLSAYYRAAPGVDPQSVVPFPFGMELIAGDQTTSTAADMDEAAGWTCGSSTRLGTEPADCPVTAPLHMVLHLPGLLERHRRAQRRLPLTRRVLRSGHLSRGIPGPRPAVDHGDQVPDLGVGSRPASRVGQRPFGPRRLPQLLGYDWPQP